MRHSVPTLSIYSVLVQWLQFQAKLPVAPHLVYSPVMPTLDLAPASVAQISGTETEEVRITMEWAKKWSLLLRNCRKGLPLAFAIEDGVFWERISSYANEDRFLKHILIDGVFKSEGDL